MRIKRKNPGCDFDIEKQREEYLDVIHEDNGDMTIEKIEKKRYFIVIKNEKKRNNSTRGCKIPL